ncbi:MAG: S8 family serine peptidase, partial [Candidatus Lokiarchaeota archaeon]|nr:S8 family serine peptidase [Candidatus Lokiarchaeota archaeon]
MKKSHYCFLILLVILSPLVVYLISVDLPKSYNKLKLSADFNAQSYLGLEDPLNEGLTGNNITVAVLDTGIYETHSVFGGLNWEDKIIGYYDWEINGTTTPPEDVDPNSHGTIVSSIIAGDGSTRDDPFSPLDDYSGIAPNSNLLSMKVFYDSAEDITSDVGTLENAIEWLKYNKDNYSVRVASMSLGVSYKSSENIKRYLDNLIDSLVDNNILTVVAAGNDGEFGLGTIESPASAESALSVGAVDNNGEMATFSAKGPTYDNIIKPDVCAPGVGIKGAIKGGTYSYGFISGTSASTPFVSGLAALLLEKKNNLTALELKNIISLTSYRTIGPRTIKDNIQGWGVVQGYAAIDALNPPTEITTN